MQAKTYLPLTTQKTNKMNQTMLQNQMDETILNIIYKTEKILAQESYFVNIYEPQMIGNLLTLYIYYNSGKKK